MICCVPRTKLKIAFRCDSSSTIGTGHVSRCLVLAKVLRDSGHQCDFLVQKLDGNVNDRITNKGFPIYYVNETETYKDEYDVVIVDHYGLDAEWETEVSNSGRTAVVVIDDLGGRQHNCDLLIDYTSLADESTNSLKLGVKYTLIDLSYSLMSRIRTKPRNEWNVLITFGGVDPTSETEKVIEGILKLTNFRITMHVVTNSLNKDRLIRTYGGFDNVYFYFGNMDSLAALMSSCDVGFAPASVTAWEMAANGLPAYYTVTASNQNKSALALNNNRLGLKLLDSEYTDKYYYCTLMEKVMNQTSNHTIKSYSKRAISTVDPYGVLRVASAIEELLISSEVPYVFS